MTVVSDEVPNGGWSRDKTVGRRGRSKHTMTEGDDTGYVRHGTALSRRLFSALGIESARDKRAETDENGTE